MPNSASDSISSPFSQFYLKMEKKIPNRLTEVADASHFMLLRSTTVSMLHF